MPGKELIDEVLKKAGVALSQEDNTLIYDAVQRVSGLNHPKLGTDVAHHINLLLDRVLENNSNLQDYKIELQKAFLDIASNDNAKAILKKEFDSPGQHLKKESSPSDLDTIVEGLKTISEDESIIWLIGNENAKIFSEKVSVLAQQYNNSASPETKGEELLESLKQLERWSKEEAEKSKGDNFSKIGVVISSYAKAVTSFLVGDKKSYTENMQKAALAIKMLGVYSEGLDIISEAVAKSINVVQPKESGQSKQKGNPGTTKRAEIMGSIINR